MSQKYISILNCEICRNFPQKAHEDLKFSLSDSKFPKQDKLLTALEIEEDMDEPYCSSTTKIFKCPLCGTYYYFNHYVDDGQHFMDPTYNEMTFRRYDFPTVKRFFEGIAGVKDGTLPHAVGTLKKAFLDGSTPNQTQIADKRSEKKIEYASKELLELNNRYNDAIYDLISCLKKEIPNLALKNYIIESLCSHFLNEGKPDMIDSLLLKHEDVVIQVKTANYLVGISTTDAPVSDLIHVPRKFLESSKTFITDKKYLSELKEIFLLAALTAKEIVLEYENEYHHYKKPLQYDALYGLVVITEYIDLSKEIPKIVNLFLPKDIGLNHNAAWLLKKICTSKANAVAIMEEIEKREDFKKSKILEDKEVQSLIMECNKKIRTRNPKGASPKSSTKKPKGTSSQKSSAKTPKGSRSKKRKK